MSAFGVSRRKMFEAGGIALAGTALLTAAGPVLAGGSDKGAAARTYYKDWEKKDWGPFDAILADNFTFTSPLDDHISKADFKKRCWDTQIDYIEKFDIELLVAQGDDVMVQYLCHTKNGKSFRNIERHVVRNQRIESIQCFFGGDSTFASAVATGKA